jgi:hypothetical protein
MPNIGENWKCSYCGHAQAIGENRYHENLRNIYVEGWERGKAAQSVQTIVCANEECKKLSLAFTLYEHDGYNSNRELENIRAVHHWQLLPASSAEPQPEYIRRRCAATTRKHARSAT